MRVAHRKLHGGYQNNHTCSSRRPSSKLWGMMINGLMGCFTSAAGLRCPWAHRVWGWCLILPFVLRVAGFVWGPRWMRHAVNFFYIYICGASKSEVTQYISAGVLCGQIEGTRHKLSVKWFETFIAPSGISTLACDSVMSRKVKSVSPRAIRERVAYSILCIVLFRQAWRWITSPKWHNVSWTTFCWNEIF